MATGAADASALLESQGREFNPEFVEYAAQYGLSPEQLLVGMADEEASGDFDGIPRAYAEETWAEANRTGETPSEVLGAAAGGTRGRAGGGGGRRSRTGWGIWSRGAMTRAPSRA